jgi:hypothetical protein
VSARAVVSCALGALLVDLEQEEVIDEPASDPVAAGDAGVTLPRLVAAARMGSTVVAVVDRRPPLLVSHDAGLTWREAGAGLPAGRAVSIAPDDPDLVLFAGVERLYLSHDGGRFWQVLSLELPEITVVELLPRFAGG